MKFKELQKNWNTFGEEDPYWSILTKEGTKGNRWDEAAFFKTGEPFCKRILEKTKKLAPDMGFEKALDFGCGAGRITQSLAPFFKETYGVDVASSMIDLANKKNNFGKQCTYFLNEKEDLQLFPDGDFDFIISFITLQHMERRFSSRYIQEFLRLLKPGGVAVFQIPAHITGLRKYLYPLFGKLLKTIFSILNKGEPIMEMYGIPKRKMIQLIEGQGGGVLDIQDDFSAGDTWKSFTYFVTK